MSNDNDSNDFISLIAKSFVTGLIITGTAILLVVFSASNSVQAKSNPAALDMRVKEAMALNEKGDYKGALSILLVAIKENPDKQSLRMLLQQTLLLQVEKQVETDKGLIQKNPHDVEAYLDMSDAFSLIDQRVDAMQTVLDGLYENPESHQLWAKMGRLELAAERYAEALSIFKKVVQMAPANAEAHYVMAFLLLREQKVGYAVLKTALLHAEKALAIDPTNPEFMQMLAEASFRIGNSHKAVQLIQQASRIAPENESNQVLLERYESAGLQKSSY